jgi:hypothetical protein
VGGSADYEVVQIGLLKLGGTASFMTLTILRPSLGQARRGVYANRFFGTFPKDRC